MKHKLIGSSNSLEHLLDMVIEKYFCRSQVSFIMAKQNEWTVNNSSGPIKGLRVVAKRGRYRFEKEQT
jgi:hypothetical protein